jgi:type II secretory pathway pseudopilin PulG
MSLIEGNNHLTYKREILMLKRFKALQRKKLRGATLVETLLVMGVIGILAIGGLGMYQIVVGGNKVNQANTQLQAYVGGVQTLYTTQTSYTGINANVIIKTNIAPANAVRGAALVNPWGGATTFSGTNTYFDIVMAGIPDEACSNILSLGLIDSGSIYEIRVGSATFSTTNIPTPASAVAACVGPNNSNTITFRSR